MEEGEDRRGMGEGEEGKRWKSESEKVNEVNGERGEFDENGVCSELQKGQKVKSDFS